MSDKNIFPLKLERIGGSSLFGGSCRAWVAEREINTFKRIFLKPIIDYSESNSKGTRGVYALYLLVPGKLYEISEPTSWKNTHRYHAIVKNGKLRILSGEILLKKDEIIKLMREP